MDEKKYFVEQIDKLIKYGRENGNMVSEKVVSEYFKEINLSNEQLQLVYNFLYDSKIGLNEPFDVEETLDEEDKDYLQMYIEELESIEKISDKKRFELIKKHVSTREDLSSKIIESYLWDVIETAKLYAGGAVTIEDLIGEGNDSRCCIIPALPIQSVLVARIRRRADKASCSRFLCNNIIPFQSDLLTDKSPVRMRNPEFI